jgi:D-alanyl-lipoteichoic acid acyltransferase DltB (MBOAT superfamily)
MGMTMFTLGLAKKVLLADTAALYATPVFATAAAGNFVGFMAAWQAALAYTLQLYFDFSGYCDMAIGSALLFGIRLPVNFDSPYQATSIIDFWRRWHITLSRFLRDYVYIPLGGNRFGLSRRYGNVLLTMLIGGLWHGANWTFVIWGGLHGLYLIVNHTWRHMGCPNVGAWPSRVLTFIAVMVAWVFFRAADMPTALSLLQSMAGQHGAGTLPYEGVWLCAVLLLFAWFAPNTQELTGYTGPAGIYGEAKTQAAGHALRWQLSWHWAVATGCLFAVAMLSLSRISEFIYFQF